MDAILNRSNFDVIDNQGPNKLARFLRSNLTKAKAADLAVAFFSHKRVSTALPMLRRVAARGEVRVLTGLFYQDLTDPKAPRALLRAQEQTNEPLEVRLSRNRKFHQKLYIIKQKARLQAVIGSSNLTQDGLRSDGELTVAVALHTDSPPARRLSGSFEEQWDDNQAVAVTKTRLRLYKKRYRRTQKPTAPKGVPSHQRNSGKRRLS